MDDIPDLGIGQDGILEVLVFVIGKVLGYPPRENRGFNEFHG
jgi:hypothetical protein